MPEELEVRVRNLVTMRELFDRLEEQHQLLREMAHRDRLTALYNRHYLSEVVPPMFAEAKKKKAPVSAIVVDVDFFKRVNDTHGHAVGDEVLVRVAHVLDAPVGAKRIALRTGGEEFLLLLPGADLPAAIAEAERLRVTIEQLRPAGLAITASLGVATRQPEEAFDPLFSRADSALYRAKESGRNRVVDEREVAGSSAAPGGV
jgi:two-component system cell cycle response regulator